MASTPLLRPEVFVRWFREAAPYIHAFRGQTFVVAFGGELVQDGQLAGLSHDLNLLNSLGVNLVLVHGARPQIDARITGRRLRPAYADGLRITDDAALECVAEAVGVLRLKIESALSLGVAHSTVRHASLRVVAGNFVTARPAGVRNGVDLMHTGEVRKVDAAAVRRQLEQGAIVLLSPLGHSPTGETFNLSMEEVAARAAVALEADKLLFLTDAPGVLDAAGQLVRQLTPDSAAALPAAEQPADVRRYLPAALLAVDHGVQRAHLISRQTDGALLQELFSHAGIGTMLSAQPLERTRAADINDVAGILGLIAPLEADGILVRRSRERLEMEIDRFHVIEHDGRIIACAALYPFAEEGMAEMACLAVDPAYREGGRGEALLEHIQAQARRMGLRALFVLTTRTAHWFVERGFVEAGVDALPAARQKLYNYQRRSKVFVKPLAE